MPPAGQLDGIIRRTSEGGQGVPGSGRPPQASDRLLYPKTGSTNLGPGRGAASEEQCEVNQGSRPPLASIRR